MAARSMVVRIAAATETRVTVGPINVVISAPISAKAIQLRPAHRVPKRHPARRHPPAPASVVPMAAGEEIATGAAAVVASVRAMGPRHQLRPTVKARPPKASAVTLGRIGDKIAAPIADKKAEQIVVAMIATAVTAAGGPKVATVGATIAARSATTARMA